MPAKFAISTLEILLPQTMDDIGTVKSSITTLQVSAGKAHFNLRGPSEQPCLNAPGGLFPAAPCRRASRVARSTSMQQKWSKRIGESAKELAEIRSSRSEVARVDLSLDVGLGYLERPATDMLRFGTSGNYYACLETYWQLY
eukprot:765293-Hanusia_phi.AAC.2